MYCTTQNCVCYVQDPVCLGIPHWNVNMRIVGGANIDHHLYAQSGTWYLSVTSHPTQAVLTRGASSTYITVITRDTTSKTFVCATRPTFPFASPETNTRYTRKSIRLTRSSTLDDLKRPQKTLTKKVQPYRGMTLIQRTLQLVAIEILNWRIRHANERQVTLK